MPFGIFFSSVGSEFKSADILFGFYLYKVDIIKRWSSAWVDVIDFKIVDLAFKLELIIVNFVVMLLLLLLLAICLQHAVFQQLKQSSYISIFLCYKPFK